MVGRNEPCPCGSGKKHKKCCGRPKDIHELIDEELERVMEGAVNEGLGHREHKEISERIDKWSKELAGLFDEELIETLAFETYMYMERQDLWRRFLIRQANSAQRPQVQEVLTAWQRPFIALGKVTANDGITLTLQDEVTKQLYTIAANAYRGDGGWLFGTVMPDPRGGERSLQGTAGLMFIPPNHEQLMEALKERLQAFDGDVLALYKLFGEFEGELEFSAFEQDVLAAVDRYLTEHKLERDTMMRIAQLFLLKEDVNARKAEAVAAGLIAGATESAVFGDRESTQKEIGNYFGVASGTLAKYRDMVADFIAERVSQVVSEQFGTAEEIGTDPQATERELWEMFTRVSRHEGASADELDRMLQEEQNRPFEPETDEERAQLLCYEAYAADDDAERLRLARQAAELAPDLTDVNLLLAEQEKQPLQKNTYFLKGLNAGLRRFENDFDDTWLYVPNRPALRGLFAYGAWKLTEGDAGQAVQELAYLLERNSQDHQGTGWLLASALLAAGQLDEAEQLLEVIDSVTADAKRFLTELHGLLETGASLEEAVNRLLEVDAANEEVKALLRKMDNPGAFPRQISLIENEGEFIYWLLYWPLMTLKA